MKLDTELKPELVVRKELDRPALADPYLDAKSKRLVATDGHRMVVIPVEVAKDEKSRWIHRDVIAAWRLLSGGAVVEFDEASGASFVACSQERGKFPAWKKALPEVKQGDPGTVTFGVDVDLLVGLADALGCEKGKRKVIVTVPLRGRNKSLLVSRHDATPESAFGCLMPVRFDYSDKGAEGIVVEPMPAEGEQP